MELVKVFKHWNYVVDLHGRRDFQVMVPKISVEIWELVQGADFTV